MVDEARSDLPKWAITMINATLCSCVIMSLVTILSLKEQIAVMQNEVSAMREMLGKDIEAAALRQQVKDAQQDSLIAALSSNQARN